MDFLIIIDVAVILLIEIQHVFLYVDPLLLTVRHEKWILHYLVPDTAFPPCIAIDHIEMEILTILNTKSILSFRML